MIYTVTPNPSIDYYMYFRGAEAAMGKINRSAYEQFCPGGKGVNVSLVLSRLGTPSCALGFVGGESGKMFLNLLESEGISSGFVSLPQGDTRINVKVYDGRETAFNACGPELDERSVRELINRVETALVPGDILVLNGNVHKNSKELYVSLAEIADRAGALLAADTEKEVLLQVIEKKPFLIKPNLQELADCFGLQTVDENTAVGLARRLQEKGAQNILLSMGDEGALYFDRSGEILKVFSRRRGEAVSTVGAGDSMLAGFLHGFSRGLEICGTLRCAAAAGTACAFSPLLPSKEDMEELMPEIEIIGYRQSE